MRPEAVNVYLSVGSNVEPERHIRLALAVLARRFGPLDCSPVYRNSPIGFDGDDFLNLVAAFKTDEPGAEVIAALEHTHDLAGRERDGERFGPRVLDIDLLLYGDAVDASLRVPRDDIERYAFVLRPLADLAPALRHPVSGVTMAELWSGFDDEAHPMQRVDLDLADGGVESTARENVTQFAKAGRGRA
jgi:2-amino-4-hydroxy-6-hydroxymethyldihydropteridine diphosphokinase